MSALLPPDAYRYDLRRHIKRDLLVNARGIMLACMLNPSTAKAEETFDPKKDDQTVRKLKEFTRRWGFRELRIVNLFAFKATKPASLWANLASGVDVVGPDNDAKILEEANLADIVVCGWGRLPPQAWKRRDDVLARLLTIERHGTLFCVGRNGDGSPLHPCFAPYVSEPVVWKVRKAAA